MWKIDCMCLLGHREFPFWNQNLRDAILRTLQLTETSIWKSIFSWVLLCEPVQVSCYFAPSVAIFCNNRGSGEKPWSSDVYLTIEANCSFAEKNKRPRVSKILHCLCVCVCVHMCIYEYFACTWVYSLSVCVRKWDVSIKFKNKDKNIL